MSDNELIHIKHDVDKIGLFNMAHESVKTTPSMKVLNNIGARLNTKKLNGRRCISLGNGRINVITPRLKNVI